MSKNAYHKFGVVDDKGDFFEFHWEPDEAGDCRLETIVQTERGPRRTVLAIVPTATWVVVSARAVRELTAGMGESERSKRSPTIKNGVNRMSPLLGRELTVLLWALMEEGAENNLEAILHGWRELAREERWWLFTKAAVPGQHAGAGWRRALFHALSEASDSRNASMSEEKKSPRNAFPSIRKSPSSPKRAKTPSSRAQKTGLKEETHQQSPNPMPAPFPKGRKKAEKVDRKVNTNS